MVSRRGQSKRCRSRSASPVGSMIRRRAYPTIVHAPTIPHPSTGRFLQEDPIWFEAGDLNVYRYVWNSPANWTDLSGMSAASERVGLGAIAIGVQQGLTINRSVQVAVWVRRWSGTRYVLQQVVKEVTLQNKGLGCVIGLKLASIGATIEITL